MSFDQLFGNQPLKDLLLRGLGQNRLPHSLLFTGSEGIGKRQFALALAQAYNCPVSPFAGCGHCATCLRIEKKEHPDVQLISPDGAFIKVAQIRAELEKLSFEPFEGNRRVVIFDSAERMNLNAANALLKMLEEPPVHTSLILVTPNAQALLETIRSRCQIFRFQPLTIAEMEAYLSQNVRRPVEENQLLARIALGSPGRVTGIDLTEYRAMRKEAMELIELLGKGTQRVRLFKAATHFGKKERDEFEARLNLIESVLHDVLYLLNNVEPEKLIHLDVLTRLKSISQQFTIERLAELLRRFENIRKNMVRNANRTMQLEAMFLEFIASKV